MSHKVVKRPLSRNKENMDLRRLALDERRLQLEEKRLDYEMKKAPSNLTKWIAITALVISFLGIWPNAAAGMVSALLVFKGKGMEIKNQEVINERELKFKVASFLMNNWRELNNKTPKEKRFFASLIEDSLSPDESLQLLAKLEEISPPATKSIWREAKARIVSTQPAAAEAVLQGNEKATTVAQESKTSETFRSLSGSHSNSSLWATGSNVSLSDDFVKTNGGHGITSGWNSAGTPTDNYLSGSRVLAIPAASNEAPIIDYSSLTTRPSSYTSPSLQITTAINAPGDSQVVVRFTEGQFSTEPSRSMPPLYLSIMGTSRSTSEANTGDIGALGTNARNGLEPASRLWITGAPRLEVRNSLILDNLGGLGSDTPIIKSVASEYPFALSNTRPGSPILKELGTIKTEQTPQITTDLGRPRIQ